MKMMEEVTLIKWCTPHPYTPKIQGKQSPLVMKAPQYLQRLLLKEAQIDVKLDSMVLIPTTSTQK